MAVGQAEPLLNGRAWRHGGRPGRTAAQGLLRFVAALAILLGAAVPAWAVVRVGHICRVKGQEVNALLGYGMVLGLNGTGDGPKFMPTIRALASALDHFGIRALSRQELAAAKNVALVVVQATIPPTGARQGDRFDVHLTSVGACKSLAGGRLFWTPLQGPQRDQDALLAYAEGPVTIDDPKNPTTGRVVQGGVLEAEFFNLYKADDPVTGRPFFTLVLDDGHASFQAATEIARAITRDLQVQTGRGDRPGQAGAAPGTEIARALDPKNVRVNIPDWHRDDPVPFIAGVLDVALPPQVSGQPRVVINERTGTVIITGDVEISPVAITHKNLTVIAGNPPAAPGGTPASGPDIGRVDRVAGLKFESQGGANLQELVDAFNRLRVPPADLIQIIRLLDASGKLHAWLEWK